MDNYDPRLDGHRIAFVVYRDPTVTSLITMVRRMLEAGWAEDEIRGFFIENPVEDAASIMAQAGMPS